MESYLGMHRTTLAARRLANHANTLVAKAFPSALVLTRLRPARANTTHNSGPIEHTCECKALDIC